MILILDISYKKDSLYKTEFVLPVAKLVNAHEVKHYTEKYNVEDYEKIIICGTALKDNIALENLSIFNWMRTYNKPIIGICAGMLLIAKFYGANVTASKKHAELDMIKIKTLKKNPLFEGDFEAYCIHGLSIERHDSFEILAESKRCIEAIKICGKEFYGVQFHPEVRNNDIIRRFISLT